MFIDFNREMRRDPDEDRLPELVVGEFSKTTPEGTHYEMDDNGILVLKSDGKTITIGGLEFKDIDELKEKLGEDLTDADVFQYSYNAQKKIRLKPVCEGYLKINGEDFPIDKIKFNPLHKFKCDSCEIFAEPNNFPDEDDIILGCDQYTKALHMQRIPNDSLDEIVIESDNKQPLHITKKRDVASGKESLCISVELKYSQTIKDIVESMCIYNAFVDGQGTINGESVSGRKVGEKKFDESYIQFFKTLLAVENKLKQTLDISFSPPSGNIDKKTIEAVEELYQSLVCDQPVQKPAHFASIAGDKSIKERINLDEEIGKEIFLVFTSSKNVELFEATFQVVSLNGVSNVEISDYQDNGENVTLFFKESEAEEKSFLATIDFLTDEDLEKYQKENGNSLVKIFSDARPLKDLVDAVLA